MIALRASRCGCALGSLRGLARLLFCLRRPLLCVLGVCAFSACPPTSHTLARSCVARPSAPVLLNGFWVYSSLERQPTTSSHMLLPYDHGPTLQPHDDIISTTLGALTLPRWPLCLAGDALGPEACAFQSALCLCLRVRSPTLYCWPCFVAKTAVRH